MWRNLDCTMLVVQPTDIEYRDGHFWVTDQLGENVVLKRCYTPQVYMASLAAANAALAAFQREQRETCEFIPIYQSKTA